MRSPPSTPRPAEVRPPAPGARALGAPSEASDLKAARRVLPARSASPAPLALPPQRWRKTWAVLYPASPHGVARLEFFDHKGSSSGGGGRGSSRRLDCKVIRLAECVSVVPVAVESPPEPGAAAFRLDTAQRSHLLAADAPASAAWVQTLCLNAFPVRGPGASPAGPWRRCGLGGRTWAEELRWLRPSEPRGGNDSVLMLSFSLPQKGSWGPAPAENPPNLSALEMLENSLYSPTWEGSRLESCAGRRGKEGCPWEGTDWGFHGEVGSH